MMQPLVTQLRFARSEFVRCLEGVSDEDACRRIEPFNCLSWEVGHLASQEHFMWVQMAQGYDLAPALQQLVGYGQPASTPSWQEMWALWREITTRADVYLDTLTAERLNSYLERNGEQSRERVGTLLLRNTFHYWFHLGEAHAIRQALGHTGLPVFVGNLSRVTYLNEE